jgi:hypothetical protein
MSIPEYFSRLAGTWRGENKLYMMPGDPVRVSASRATVATAAQGKFLTLAYTWDFEGQPQDGLLVLGFEATDGPVTAAWVDSFHYGDKILVCTGAATPDGGATVRGSYPAPPGPDWGWRITLPVTADGVLRVVMYNIEPDGPEQLAVEADYTRQA